MCDQAKVDSLRGYGEVKEVSFEERLINSIQFHTEQSLKLTKLHLAIKQHPEFKELLDIARTTL